ncbi:MAG: hypothetical protein HN368_03530 [Spirochaetales bacterium]|jgi:hypothetical protein|nr:hypothetical protein [Spirochaetales bacterium]
MNQINPASLTSLLKKTVSELSIQPEFAWEDGIQTFATDPDDSPAVRVGVGCCSPDFDLWDGLRNPAAVGLYPAGFEEIWDYYANRRKQKTDEFGRATIFQVASTFAEAKKRYSRALVVSVMLPVASEVYSKYNTVIHDSGQAPWEGYAKVWDEVNKLIDTGITRSVYHLMDDSRAMVVLNGDTVGRVSTESVPATHQGASHGVCKGGNFPQKSVAVLTGLAQFGISRLVFRDEVSSGQHRRLIGPLRSLVIFDKGSVDNAEENGIVEITDDWKRELAQLSDFSFTAGEVNSKRHCTYIPESGEKGCGKCIAYCPSRALLNSSPQNNGEYSEKVNGQDHRFWDGQLQFDNGSCCDERGQLASLYDEWMCGRCLSICAGEGFIREAAAHAEAL